MPSALIGDLLREVLDRWSRGDPAGATALYERHLPLIQHENRQCGLRATKVLMKEGGIIASEACRHPTPPLHPANRAQLVELARSRDPLILRWAR
jgi:dihydrodipicolinate synthase/N-acetylneuraminate lyase